jgi:hypothetical protein
MGAWGVQPGPAAPPGHTCVVVLEELAGLGSMLVRCTDAYCLHTASPSADMLPGLHLVLRIWWCNDPLPPPDAACSPQKQQLQG